MLKREFWRQQEENRVTYKWSFIRLSADLSAETLQVISEGHDIFKVLNGGGEDPYNLGSSTQQDYHSELQIQAKTKSSSMQNWP